jgi:Protein phosphatase 2C
MGDGRLALEGWRFVHTAVQGSGHARAGLPCQDSTLCYSLPIVGLGDVLIGVVSDGAGSAPRSHVGAETATGALARAIEGCYSAGQSLRDLGPGDLGAWAETVRQSVTALASTEGASPRDFACTLLAAIVEPDRAAFLQIGDGAIVVSPQDDPDEYSWVFWPQRGEYANYTRFITDDDALDQIQVVIDPGTIDEVALFSDGLQPLALHYASQTAHAPLFRALFGPLRSEEPGECERISLSLRDFLSSDRVNARTDDDKSLVLGTRRPKAPDPSSATDDARPTGSGN